MRGNGFCSMAYRRAKRLQTNGGLCHPALALPLALIASGRVPLLRGRYPASSLVRTRPPGSRLHRTSPFGSYDYLASAGFLRGARSPSLLSPMALCACRRPPPRRVLRSQIGFERRCCLRRNCGGSAPGFRLTGPRPDVHSSLRPVHLLTVPSTALSVGFAGGISRPGATQAMRLRSLAASGLSPYGLMGTSRHHTITSPQRWVNVVDVKRHGRNHYPHPARQAVVQVIARAHRACPRHRWQGPAPPQAPAVENSGTTPGHHPRAAT